MPAMSSPLNTPPASIKRRIRAYIWVALSALALTACGGASQISATAPQSVGPTASARQDIAAPAPIAFDMQAYRQAPPRAEGAIVVSLLLPMSDERDAIRALAGNLYKAAQLALFDTHLRRQDGFVLRLHDTKGTPQGAQEATKAALAAQSDILVGPLFADSVKAVAPLLSGRKAKALAFSNDSRVAAPGLWLLGFLPEQNIDRIVSEAVAQGLTRFGALLPEGPYGARIGSQFDDAVRRFGGTVVQVETYPANAKDMFDPVKNLAQFERRKAAHMAEMARLKQDAISLLPPETMAALPRDEADGPDADALFRSLAEIAPELVSAYEALKLTETLGDIPYDAVFMPEGGLALRNLAPLLPYFDIDPKRVKFIGTALWDDPTLAQEPPLHGGWFAAPDGGNWDGFAARFERVYRSPPPRLASMAYDAVALAGRLAAMDTDQPFSEALLINANGFAGLDGIVRLRPGGLNERGLAVREITRRTPRTVSEAPASFVDHDRRVQASLALAESLRRENPDLYLPQIGAVDETDGASETGAPSGQYQAAESEETAGTAATPISAQ